jgi:CheY-like chemotaxis protein
MNDPAIAIGAMHVLPVIWDGRALMDDNPLVMALSAPEQTIRYAAAIAILMIKPADPFTGSEMVVPIAAQAAATGSARQILVIEPNADVRAATMKNLVEGKMFPIGEATGIRGFRRALEVGTFDVIVIRYSLPDMLALALVNQLREDFRTAATPILISGTEDELAKAKETLGTKVQGYIPAEFEAGPVADAAAGSLNDDQKRALHLSKFASMALGMIHPGKTVFENYAAAEGALIGVVESDKPDDIRLAALGALGAIGSPAASDALVATFTGTANATSVRVAAAAALGQIFKGQAAPAAVFDALLGGFGDEAAEVRDACGNALGGMMLAADQRNAVLTGYRVK